MENKTTEQKNIEIVVEKLKQIYSLGFTREDVRKADSQMCEEDVICPECNESYNSEYHMSDECVRLSEDE